MALDDTIAKLAEAPLFGELEPAALRMAASLGETRRFRPNEVLFRQGERSDGGYVVLDGEFAVTRQGSDAVTLAGPGALIGQMTLFLRIQRASTAQARQRSTVLRVSPTLMRRVLETFPASAEAVRACVASDLADMTENLERVRRLLGEIDAR